MFNQKKVAQAEKLGDAQLTRKGIRFTFDDHPLAEDALRVMGLLCAAAGRPLKKMRIIEGKYHNNPPTEIILTF